MNWILCPLRNNLAFIRAALPTFLAQDLGDIRVFLWDNGSTDGTAQWANSITDDRVSYAYNVNPHSVAASWNEMLRKMFVDHGVSHALVVNADVELRPDTYRNLLTYGGLFVTAVGTADKSNINPPYHLPDPKMNRPHPDFSCFLIRRECWERVGPFDEGMGGAYCEDSDYHIRMHRAGIEAICLDLPFYHVGAGTLKNADEAETTRIQKQADKNRALFRQKYGCEVGSKEYYALFGNGAPEDKVISYGKAFRNGGVGKPTTKVNIVLVTNGSRQRLLDQTLLTLYQNTPYEQFNLTIAHDGISDFGRRPQLRHNDNAWGVTIWPPCNIIGRLKNLGAYWSEKQFGRGEWLCFIDDDMAFFPGWIWKMKYACSGMPFHVIGGVRHPYHQPLFTSHDGDRAVEVTDAVAGYCHFMRWETWDKYGPYDAHAKGTGQSEDWAICRKIVEDGGKVGYIHPPVMAHCGITSSEGKPAVGSEQIERIEGVLYE